MVRPTGFEPVAPRLGIWCSILLSYGRRRKFSIGRLRYCRSPFASMKRRAISALVPCTKCASEYRSEEHTSELQSLMRISYAVFCLTKKTTSKQQQSEHRPHI